MTLVTLADADIGLFSRFTRTRIRIPHLIVADGMEAWNSAEVHFDIGDDGPSDPVEVRGIHRTRTVQCTARFPHHSHADYLALLDLFQLARLSADARLQLRTHGGNVAGLDELEVGTVASWTRQRVMGQVWDVVFELRRRAWHLDEVNEALVTWEDVAAAFADHAEVAAAFDTQADLAAARSLP